MLLVIEEIRRLRKRDYRLETGLTIAEGYPEVKQAIKAGVVLRTLYICPEILTPEPGEFDDQPTVEVTKETFKEMAFGKRLKGILAICETKTYLLNDLQLKPSSFLVILEGVEKPGNIGTIIRTADSASVDAIIMCDSRTDVYNHNIVRSSIGTVFHVPVVEATKENVLAFLQKNQIKIYPTSANANYLYTQVNFKSSSAIIIGNEHDGVSSFWDKTLDERIKIPVLGTASSLNAAMSASVIIYEALRQRQL